MTDTPDAIRWHETILTLGPAQQLDEEGVEWLGIPELEELFRYGGWPGVRYALIEAHQLSHFRRYHWRESPVPALTIHSPVNGAVIESVKLVQQGEPIRAASPVNGSRMYGISDSLLEKLGYSDPSLSNLPLERIQEETAKSKATGATHGQKAKASNNQQGSHGPQGKEDSPGRGSARA